MNNKACSESIFLSGQIQLETKSLGVEYIGVDFHCLHLRGFLFHIISLICSPYRQKPSRVHIGQLILQHSLNIVEILNNIVHETICNVAAKKGSLWNHMLGDEKKI